MMECYPVISNAQIRLCIRTLPDFVEIYDLNGSKRVFLWEGDRGFLFDDDSVFYKAMYESPMIPKECMQLKVEERVKEFADRYKDVLKDKHVMVDLSGGKDSTASLILLTYIREIIDFRITAVYVHFPFLEPFENILFVEKIAQKLDVKLKVVEVDRKRALFYLLREGLPRRGLRWCTYLKTRALRSAKKELKADFEAKGDRMQEAGKRMKRLSEMKRKNTFIEGRTINLIYDLSLLEVSEILHREGLIHPHYKQGLPRVSCKYCPYRSLYELKVSEKHVTENEELIHYILERNYQRLYSHISDFETFMKYHLWRFEPSIAKIRLKLKPPGKEETLSIDAAREMFASLWNENPSKVCQTQ